MEPYFKPLAQGLSEDVNTLGRWFFPAPGSPVPWQSPKKTKTATPTPDPALPTINPDQQQWMGGLQGMTQMPQASFQHLVTTLANLRPASIPRVGAAGSSGKGVGANTASPAPATPSVQANPALGTANPGIPAVGSPGTQGPSMDRTSAMRNQYMTNAPQVQNPMAPAAPNAPLPQGPSIWTNPGFLFMLAKLGSAISPEGTIGKSLGDATAELNQQQAIANFEGRQGFVGPVTPGQARFNRMNDIAVPYPVRSELRKESDRKLERAKDRALTVSENEKNRIASAERQQSSQEFAAGQTDKTIQAAQDRQTSQQAFAREMADLKSKYANNSAAFTPNDFMRTLEIKKAIPQQARTDAISVVLERMQSKYPGLNAEDLKDLSSPRWGDMNQHGKDSILRSIEWLTNEIARQYLEAFKAAFPFAP